jgi:hypothetical protein
LSLAIDQHAAVYLQICCALVPGGSGCGHGVGRDSG